MVAYFSSLNVWFALKASQSEAAPLESTEFKERLWKREHQSWYVQVVKI